MSGLRFTTLVDGLQHPEGLCWDPNVERIYCGGEGGQVYEVTLQGVARQVATTGGSLLGLAVDGDGVIYACDAGLGEVLRVEPGTGKVTTYSRGSADEPFREPNSAAFDDRGNLYVVDSENEAIFRISGDGETTVWSRAVDGYPNGCALTPDGSALVVVQSHPSDLEGGRVWSIPIMRDGSAGRAWVLVELPRAVPDGVAYDAEGGLWIAHYRPDRIDRVGPRGDVETLVDDWAAVTLDAPTNVAFVGAELDRVVAACVGDSFLAIARPEVRGLPLRRPGRNAAGRSGGGITR